MSLAAAGLAGSVVLSLLLAVLGYFYGFSRALVVWAIWWALAGVFVLRGPANALGRSVAGWREPRPDEGEILTNAFIRVCVAAGENWGSFTHRVARGSWNAHASGRNILAATADVLTGEDAVEPVELEAMLAHELAHHRHRDLLLAGPKWWLLAPLALVDVVGRALSHVPLLGPPLAAALWFPFRWIVFPFRAISSLASRPRELAADRFAVDCGYALPLERLFERFAGLERSWQGGLFEWMLSTHPGAADRIAEIRGVEAETAGIPRLVSEA